MNELHARLPDTNDHLLLEVFLSENRPKLNRPEPNCARDTTELVMAGCRKVMELNAAKDRNNRSD
jgi:hypothetical protein